MKVNYRNIKYPRMEFRTGELLLILPHGTEPVSLIDKYSGWIDEKKSFIQKALKKSDKLALDSHDLEAAKSRVKKLVGKYAGELGVTFNRITFRRLKSKWGSCSKSGTLTFNKDLRYLPDYIVRYIVYHETTHLISPKHDSKFWQIIESKFKNHQQLEARLFSYWFLIQRYKGE